LNEFNQGVYSEQKADANDRREGMIGLAWIFDYLFIVIFVSVWIYKAHKNAIHYGIVKDYSAGWAVGSFFVPVANLVYPYRAMKEIWEMFYNKDTQLLQKNIIKENDLFVSPIDINDSNIPNGNSVYLNLCNKLYTITNDKFWMEKVEILKKSFHQVINSFFSQMFSFIKTLDLCDNNISFTFFGNQNSIKDIKNDLQKNYLGRATFIYKNKDEINGSVVVCKNQTCSEKLTNLAKINSFMESKL